MNPNTKLQYLLSVMLNSIYSKYHHYTSHDKASKMAQCMFVRIRITIHTTAKKVDKWNQCSVGIHAAENCAMIVCTLPTKK